MRTLFTGVGTALVTPFTSSGAVDEGGGSSSGTSADRCRRPLPRALRTTGEAPTLSAAEAARRRELRGRRGRGRAGAGRRRWLRHARGDRARRAMGRPAHGSAVGRPVLQQADAGRALPALPGNRRRHAVADRRLQRARTHRRQRGDRDARRLAAIPNIVGVKEASGNMPRSARVCARAARTSWSCAATTWYAAAMAIGGHGVISVASNEVPADGAQIVEAVERGDFAAARALHNRFPAADAGELRRRQPDPSESRDGRDGTARGVLRLPMCSPQPASRDAIRHVLKTLHLLESCWRKTPVYFSSARTSSLTRQRVHTDGLKSCQPRVA